MEKAQIRQGTIEVQPSTAIVQYKDQGPASVQSESLRHRGGILDLGFRIGAAPGIPRFTIIAFLLPGILLLVILSGFSVAAGSSKGERGAPSFDEFRVIADRNMFSSRRQASKKEAEYRSIPTAVSVNVEVIGIVKTDDPLSSIAIVKDHGRHVPCRVGDTVGGMLITEIRTSEIFFETAAGTRIAKIQPGMASGTAVKPSIRRPIARAMPVLSGSASSSGRRVPINVTDIQQLARTLPLVTHREDGQAKGLRLTRDIMGLREGDRVTAVGGQSLHTRSPKQKLLQITRKYHQYGREMPEIPVEVERDNKKLELVLVPTS